MALWLMLLTLPAAAAIQDVSSVRIHRAPDHTRLVFDLNGPVEHKVDRLSNPERLVIDLDNVDLKFDMATLTLDGTPISGVRVGRHAEGKTRVVLDLSAQVRPRTNQLKPFEPHGWRLVVDLFDTEPVAGAGRSAATPAPTPPPAATTPGSSPRPQPQPQGARPMIVAIDPGHGGEDPGAIGPGGVQEKKIVLQIAQRVYRMMQAEPGLRPVLVRDGDYYVPLAERRRIAAEKGADAFISIHADAFTNATAHGASVFALSSRGATSAQADYLARIANDSDRVAGVYEEEKDNGGLLGVLADMTMEGTLAHSLILAEGMIGELGKVTRLHGNRHKVEQANFAVLREPTMVSVLVETGFISNRDEARKLQTSAHQEKVARAIVNGVREYFTHHPQPGSWFAAERRRGNGALTHRIANGETLSSIARRYSVSEQALRSANNVNGDLIRVGQTLTIPGS